MPEYHRDYEHPEELLVGSDRPRPLPANLRARLEEVLEAPGTVATARPLSAEVRGKLETSLKPERHGKKWAVLMPTVGAAAAIVIAAAVAVPALVHGTRTSTTGTFSANAAGPSPKRSGLFVHRSVQGAGSAEGASGAVAGNPQERTAHEPAANSGVTKTIGGSSVPPAPAPTALRGVLAVPATPMVPVVSAVSPRLGPANGGNWVVLKGTNFSRASLVYFGTGAATRLSVTAAGELKVMAPAHALGTVDVVVAGPDGRSKVSAADHYAFVR
jgi:IPT/TIG domain